MRIAFLAVEARDVVDLQEVQRVMPRIGIVARPLGAQGLAAIDLDQLGDEILDLEHAVDEGLDHIVRRRAVIGRLQVGEGRVPVVRQPQPAAGADRYAARMGHLFDQQDLRAGIVRGDGADRAGETVADDDDVDRFVETLDGAGMSGHRLRPFM